MKQKIIILILSIWATIPTVSAQKVTIYSTTATERWVKKKYSLEKNSLAQTDISIYTDSLLQNMDGFGGTFNELGWDALQVLPANKQTEIMQSLFGSSGINFSMARTPIGASDYALSYYSYCDVKEDYTMRDFSISRDKYILIPYIKEALKLRPDLKIWASPWTPPAWMKINEHYTLRGGDIAGRNGGNEMPERKNVTSNSTAFNMQTGYLKAYALYFSKYIQEYKKEGINIWAVMPQNEIAWSPNWPCCTWHSHDLSHFIGKYLGPQFESDKLNTEIWLGTINFPQPDYVRDVLKDKDASKYIKGVGFQWSGEKAIPHISKEYPQIKYMQTENVCGEHENNWSSFEKTWKAVTHYLQNNASSYMYWNMILDETGSSSWGWAQNSLIRIDRTTQQVLFTDEYYLMKHLSHFVQPGANVLKTSDMDTVLAFKTSESETVIVLYNSGKAKNTNIKVSGNILSILVPEKSINTIIINSKKS